MPERRNLDRVQRALGSQPQLHEDPTVDALRAMCLALLGEISVLRDRLDANERLSAGAGGHGPADVDAFVPDPEMSAHRARYREACYDRVLGAARDRLMPAMLREEQRDYEQVIDDVSKQ